MNESLKQLISQITPAKGFSEEEIDSITKNLLSIPPEKMSNEFHGLSEAFLWDATPQGHEYWSNIHHRLYGPELPGGLYVKDYLGFDDENII